MKQAIKKLRNREKYLQKQKATPQAQKPEKENYISSRQLKKVKKNWDREIRNYEKKLKDQKLQLAERTTKIIKLKFKSMKN